MMGGGPGGMMGGGGGPDLGARKPSTKSTMDDEDIADEDKMEL